MPIKTLSFLVLCLFVSGCSSVDPRASLPEIQKLALERTGKKIYWRGDSKADAEIDAHLRELLKSELGMHEAVQIALLNNRELQATYEMLGVAQADLIQAGLLTNPVLDAEVRFHESGGKPGAELSIVQNFIELFYIPLRKRIAEAAFEGAKLRVAGEIIDLSGQVKTAFIEYQAAQQTLEMRQQVLRATEATYAIAGRLRKAGNITELELANERALFEQSKLNVRTAELTVLKTRERLNSLMGLWGADTRWEPKGHLADLPAEVLDEKELERIAVTRSIDLAIAHKEVEELGQTLNIARPFAILPDVGLGASAEHEAEGGWGIGPAFSIPLVLLNQGQPAITSAQARFRSASERYRALAVSLRAQLRAARAALIAARETAHYYAKVYLPLTDQVVRQTQLQYNAMQLGPFQLLLAKQQQIDAGTAYISALRTYWLAHTELGQLLNGRMSGGLQAEAPESDGNAPMSNRREH